MDGRDNSNTGTNRTARRRPAAGSKPRLRVFLPYLLLALVFAAMFVWVFVLGPVGDSDRGELMHQEGAQSGEAAPARE